MIPHIAKLSIYPIKSLDAVSVEQVTVLESGALKQSLTDRQWAIFDELGNFANGKRHPKIHALRTQFYLDTNIVELNLQNTDIRVSFNLKQDLAALEEWLSNYFGFPVWVRQNLDAGFPDDIISPGPTIISTATLETVASWYPGLDLEQVRRRFRANIEIGGVPAFWEDRLFGAQTVNFQIGDVKFIGVNPCQRCVVITRDAQTGEAYPNFQKIFVTKRRETLPEWTDKSRFNHFYRLAINTRLREIQASPRDGKVSPAPSSERGKIIKIGDLVKID
ncbi:MOSC domain-containing protein [Merismopedia glauca]|uniref:MOSC domain-containing protein n=1 Tax=Merismopedia glauca CCAP 1448/3 TaxID=1296344 RepID=A0A2T1C8I3_9CYAN|nr:MOSC N-terminal beta barrel domain-containing protein [Merismopedia glauca]PSB04566.1 MOSC domain-containing protein [Merismopedia glauca CCAP 1448/3]